MQFFFFFFSACQKCAILVTPRAGENENKKLSHEKEKKKKLSHGQLTGVLIDRYFWRVICKNSHLKYITFDLIISVTQLIVCSRKPGGDPPLGGWLTESRYI